MEKVRPWCGQPSDRRRLLNRTERTEHCMYSYHISIITAEMDMGWVHPWVGLGWVE